MAGVFGGNDQNRPVPQVDGVRAVANPGERRRREDAGRRPGRETGDAGGYQERNTDGWEQRGGARERRRRAERDRRVRDQTAPDPPGGSANAAGNPREPAGGKREERAEAQLPRADEWREVRAIRI